MIKKAYIQPQAEVIPAPEPLCQTVNPSKDMNVEDSGGKENDWDDDDDDNGFGNGLDHNHWQRRWQRTRQNVWDME